MVYTQSLLQHSVIQPICQRPANGTSIPVIEKIRSGTLSHRCFLGFRLFHRRRIRKLVFVASGQGMQTVMGMLRFLRETNDQRPVIVLHISRPDESRLCQKEIDRMPRHIRYCRVERALDGQREGCGPCLSKKDLEAHYRKFWPGAHVFLCGPASMVEQLRPLLLELGVRERRICPEITPDNCISEAAAHR